MSLRSEINGTLTLSDLARLKLPVAWSATKDREEATAEEAELYRFADEASEQLEQAYTHWNSDDDALPLAVKVENGEVLEIVEA